MTRRVLVPQQGIELSPCAVEVQSLLCVCVCVCVCVRLPWSFFFFFLNYLFIYFWLRWVFVAVRGLSLVAERGL